MNNILFDLQTFVADALSEELSAYTPVLAENRRDIEFSIQNALKRQGICTLVATPKARFLGKYQDDTLGWEVEELQVLVTEMPTVNRGRKDAEVLTGQDVAMRVFEILCPLSGEGEGRFCPVSYEQGEEGGILVNKCVLRCALYGSRQGDGGEVPPPVGVDDHEPNDKV